MTNTALRAEAQSATSHKESVAYGDHPYDITHMVFTNELLACMQIRQRAYLRKSVS